MLITIPLSTKQRETLTLLQDQQAKVATEFQAYLLAVIQGGDHQPSLNAPVRITAAGVEITEPDIAPTASDTPSAPIALVEG